MPKLILAAAASLLGRSSAWASAEEYPAARAATHAEMHAGTRSRDATRRLRASGPRTVHPDLGPLALTRRH